MLGLGAVIISYKDFAFSCMTLVPIGFSFTVVLNPQTGCNFHLGHGSVYHHRHLLCWVQSSGRQHPLDFVLTFHNITHCALSDFKQFSYSGITHALLYLVKQLHLLVVNLSLWVFMSALSTRQCSLLMAHECSVNKLTQVTIFLVQDHKTGQCSMYQIA